MRRALGPAVVLVTMFGVLAGCGSEDRELARRRQELKPPRLPVSVW